MNPILKSLLVFVFLAAAEFAAEDFAEWRKKAETGDANAQFNLGVMYDNGMGVPKDDAEAAKWYRKAADQGNVWGQYMVGMLYHYGEGVLKDLVQAHVWYNIAGANGHERAKKNLTSIEKEMTDSQKEKAMDMARELFAKLPKEK